MILNMKKRNRLPLLAMMILMLTTASCASSAEEKPVRLLRLGTSALTMEARESLTEEAFSEESALSGMTAYLHDDETGLILEVYQYSREAYPGPLEAFVEQDAQRYGGVRVVRDGEINGIHAGWYEITDEAEEFRITYLFLEDTGDFIVIGYMIETDDAADEIKWMLDSLKRSGE